MSVTLISQPDNFAPALGGELIYRFEGSAGSDIQVLMVDSRSDTVFSAKTIYSRSLPCGINMAVPALSLFDPRPITEMSPEFKENKALTSKVTAKYFLNDDLLLRESPSRVFTLARKTVAPGALLTSMPVSNRKVSAGDCDELSIAVESGSLLENVITVAEEGKTFTMESFATITAAGLYTLPVSISCIIERSVAAGLNASRIQGIEIEVRLDGSKAGTVSYTVLRAGNNSVRLAWINSMGAIEYHTFGQVLKVAAIKTSPRSVGAQKLPVVGKNKTELKLSAGVCPKSENEALSEILASPKVWRAYEGLYREVEVVDDTAALHSDSLSPFTVTIRE